MHPGFSHPVPYVAANPNDNPWLPDYPNPPDLRFNYFKLLNDAWAARGPIGNAPKGKTVAVIGAGAAGMTVARELWRCGYQVRLFEASSRIGGRLYTEPRPNFFTAFEWGAMRMPFFNGTSQQQSTNCVLAYFLNQDQRPKTSAEMSDFPNPGAADSTGVYMNQGYGPNDCYPSPKMIPWDKGGKPQNDDLIALSQKVSDFITLFTNNVKAPYVRDDDSWTKLWRKIANNYDKMSFSDLVFTKAITQYKDDGWFGGFGMNDYESSLFSTIGVGDGSWGAFYSISAMWFIRCAMFGYSSNLASVSGLHNATALPYYNSTVNDSAGTPITPPLYRGIQSLIELLFFLSPPGKSNSLYASCLSPSDPSAQIFVNTPVVQLTRKSDGSITVKTGGNRPSTIDAHYVVVTAPIWANQLSIEFEGFDRATQLPWEVPAAIQQQHVIASGKVFFPLNRAYWKGSNIPQVIVTDTFVQDAYSFQWTGNNNDAAILASYTWEDDASKLLKTDDLANMVLDELDRITTETRQSIRPYVVTSGAKVLQWHMQPTYRGCSKLYRQRNWDACYYLLAYNQTYSAVSNLYFAGESYGVEGGWTEPALRGAMDAVIHLIKNSGGTFTGQFSFDKYPQYDTKFLLPDKFSPNEDYPQTSG